MRISGQETSPSKWVAPAYAIMLVVTATLFFLIRWEGQGRTAPPPPPGAHFGAPGAAVQGSGLLPVLVAIAVIIAASRGLGALFRRFHQPAVVGEIVAGIVLGPSVLGRVLPGTSAQLFAPSVVPLLGILAQIGVLLYMFLVGLELDTSVMRGKAHAMLAISHAGIAVPFLMGSALAIWLYPVLSTSDVPFTPFALFVGVSMSVTAFPVLARILTDRELHKTRMGNLALTCAAVGDVTAWCLLAVVVGVVQARGLAGGLETCLLTIAYIAAMFVVVAPLSRRYAARFEGRAVPGQQLMGVACLVLLLSSLATEFIGIHTLFGAFLIGAVVPHDSTVARVLRERLQDFVLVMLLPVYFAFTGLRTELGLIGIAQWPLCAAIIGVACAGKFGGSAVAARLTGMPWKEATALGILMNTRGLMELIVLNIGLDLKVISPACFAMLVVMAIVTTFATSPVLDLVARSEASGELGITQA